MATNDADNTAAKQQQLRQTAPSPGTASSSSQPPTEQEALVTPAAQRANLSQALTDLNRGERTADKLESELRAFEAKLEELLSSMGMTGEDLVEDLEEELEEVEEEVEEMLEERDNAAEEKDEKKTSKDEHSEQKKQE